MPSSFVLRYFVATVEHAFKLQRRTENLLQPWEIFLCILFFASCSIYVMLSITFRIIIFSNVHKKSCTFIASNIKKKCKERTCAEEGLFKWCAVKKDHIKYLQVFFLLLENLKSDLEKVEKRLNVLFLKLSYRKLRILKSMHTQKAFKTSYQQALIFMKNRE